RKNNKPIRRFTYIIEQEEVYLSKDILVTTGINSPNKSNNFKIPDNYIVKTTCNTFAETVTSTLSASNAALIYQQ
ncbi:14793_t:CDS:2, partial [Racocetra fulgida]